MNRTVLRSGGCKTRKERKRKNKSVKKHEKFCRERNRSRDYGIFVGHEELVVTRRKKMGRQKKKDEREEKNERKKKLT